MGSLTNDVIGLGEGGGFQIMTADDGGGGLPNMTSFFTTVLGIILPVLLLNLDKSESEFQKFINHKFSRTCNK